MLLICTTLYTLLLLRTRNVLTYTISICDEQTHQLSPLLLLSCPISRAPFPPSIVHPWPVHSRPAANQALPPAACTSTLNSPFNARSTRRVHPLTRTLTQKSKTHSPTQNARLVSSQPLRLSTRPGSLGSVNSIHVLSLGPKCLMLAPYPGALRHALRHCACVASCVAAAQEETWGRGGCGDG